VVGVGGEPLETRGTTSTLLRMSDGAGGVGATRHRELIDEYR
jgi:hypothetical protein